VPLPVDPLTRRLTDILDELAAAVVDDTETTDAVRIDRLALLERLQAVTAALQAAESVKFAQSQVAEQLAADVHPNAIGRGIAEQIALACRISPVMAAPVGYGAGIVVRTARHLQPAECRGVERAGRRGRRVGNPASRPGHAPTSRPPARRGRHKQAWIQGGCIVCPENLIRRRVGIRPAPDTMAVLTGYLPVEQGIACYTALRRQADTAVATGDGRTRHQIMADTLVERITGQTTAGDVNIELQLMMPLGALIDPDDSSAAVIPGYGPLPGGLAREILCHQQGAKMVASPLHRTE
jgi:hypothetical protein